MIVIGAVLAVIGLILGSGVLFWLGVIIAVLGVVANVAGPRVY